MLMCVKLRAFAFMSACFHVYVLELRLKGLGYTCRLERCENVSQAAV